MAKDKDGNEVIDQELDEEGNPVIEDELEEEGSDDDDEELDENGKPKVKVPKKESIDYEAELARERERANNEAAGRKKAEDALADDAFRKRESKRKEGKGDDEGADDDKPLTANQLQEILRQDRDQTRKELQGEIIRDKVGKLSGSQAEADLIIAIHKNRTFPAGLTLDEQLEEAYAIANRKRIMGQNSELKRALRSKGDRSKDGSSSHRDSTAVGAPKMSNADRTAILAAGFIWNGVNQKYEKSLAGGKKVLYYDPKNKKRWVENKK